MSRIKRYGWLPDLPDYRDILYAAPMPVLMSLPSKVDLRFQFPPVYDQGELGTAVVNAIMGAVEFDLLKNKVPGFMPSRLFNYYNARELAGTVDIDAGAHIRDAIKSLATEGDCPETEWPYAIDSVTQKPPQQAYADATKYKAVEYSRITRNLSQMKGCLASGYPFIFGFTAYDDFESMETTDTGHLCMPASHSQHPDVKGGHCVLAVGYDDSQSRFIARNSWGSGWGMNGYFTIPYTYLLEENLSDDFWTIRILI